VQAPWDMDLGFLEGGQNPGGSRGEGLSLVYLKQRVWGASSTKILEYLILSSVKISYHITGFYRKELITACLR